MPKYPTVLSDVRMCHVALFYCGLPERIVLLRITVLLCGLLIVGWYSCNIACLLAVQDGKD